MKRLVTLLSVLMLMFAVAGVHEFDAAPLGEGSGNFELVNLLQGAITGDRAECCSGSDYAQSTVHKHCGLSCAIIPKTDEGRTIEFSSVSFTSENSSLFSRQPTRLERPPRDFS